MSMSREEKLEKIDEIICAFAQKEPLTAEKKEKYDQAFQEIYTDGFRHEYSRIFLQLSEIRRENPQGIDIVAENLRDFVADREKKECKYISCLMKLFDHVSLDVARMNYMTSEFGIQESKLREYSKSTIDSTKKQINAALDNTKETIDLTLSDTQKKIEAEITVLKRKTGKMQREYVTILGIFASIIVTFMAGMIFDSSVLNNIGKVSAYRLAGISLLIGFVTFNLLYVLLGFIYKMTRDDEETGIPFKWVFFTINIGFLIATIFVIAIWYKGCIEQRNINIWSWYHP